VGPITLEALAFFSQPEGQALLAQAATPKKQDLLALQHRLRTQYPADLCRAAVALIEQRHRSTAKFTRAAHMYFDREGLEMATGEPIACYRAARLGAWDTIMDLCCGIGGDLLQLASQARVVAVDTDRVRLAMARMNAAVHGRSKIAFVQADAQTLKPQADLVFCDPARRQGQRRTRRGAEYQPPLSFILDLCRRVPAVVAKVSPAIPEEDIPPQAEAEFISFNGQCREAALYFGPLRQSQRRATLLPGPHILDDRQVPIVPVAPPGRFVFDPDPAVVRAHLIDQLAAQLNAWKLDPQIAYLSADQVIPTPFAQAFEVLHCRPFQLKDLRRFMAQEGYFPHEIKKRRFPMEPDVLRQHLKLRSGSKPVTLIMTRLAEKPTALICQRLGN